MKRRPRAATTAIAVKLSLSLAVLGTAMLGGCVQEPAPFNPRMAQDWERAQDAQVPRRPLYPMPATQESRFIPGETEPRPIPLEQRRLVPEGPPIDMTLQEIIHRTVVNSLDIRVAGYDTAVDQTRVMEAEARFDPTLISAFSYEKADKDSAGTFSSFNSQFTPTNPAFF